MKCSAIVCRCLVLSLIFLPLGLFSQTEKPAASPAPASPASGSTEIKIMRSSSVNISGPTLICEGSETILKAEGDYESFEWNTGSTDRFLRVRKEGFYEVTVVTKGGCRLTSSVTVRVVPCT